MATRSISWGTPAAATITLASLASSATAGQKSAAITIGGKPYLAIEVTLVVETGTIQNDAGAHVWLARSIDGTNYEDALSGGDAAFTPHSPSGMQYLGFVPIPVQSTANRKLFLVPDPPAYGVVVVRNYCGIALASGSGVQYTLGEDVVA